MGDANAIIEEHKRLVTNLVDSAQQFATSLPQKIDEIKGTVMQYVPNADTANNLLNTIRGYVEDMSPPGESADLYKNLLTNYLWVGVCLFAAALVNTLVGRVYVPVVGLLIGGGGVFLVSFFVLPYLMIEYLPTKIEGSDDDKRMYLLLMGVVDYLTFMVLVAGTWVPFYAPPCFLMPILIGVLSDAVGPSVGGQPRTVFLGVVLGVPAVVYLVFGAAMYSLTGMYFLWILVLTGACLVDVQMKISVLKGKGADVSSQSISLVIVLLTTFVMTYLCNGTWNDFVVVLIIAIMAVALTKQSDQIDAAQMDIPPVSPPQDAPATPEAGQEAPGGTPVEPVESAQDEKKAKKKQKKSKKKGKKHKSDEKTSEGEKQPEAVGVEKAVEADKQLPEPLVSAQASPEGDKVPDAAPLEDASKLKKSKSKKKSKKSKKKDKKSKKEEKAPEGEKQPEGSKGELGEIATPNLSPGKGSSGASSSKDKDQTERSLSEIAPPAADGGGGGAQSQYNVGVSAAASAYAKSVPNFENYSMAGVPDRAKDKSFAQAVQKMQAASKMGPPQGSMMAGKMGRRVFIMRHGERMDRLFPEWLTMAITDQGTYMPYDMNMPLVMIDRSTMGGWNAYEYDSPVTEMGALSGQMIGRGIYGCGVDIKALYSSPALRCVQTASGVLKEIENKTIKINVEPGLFEWLAWYDSMPKWLEPNILIQAKHRVNEQYQPIMPVSDLAGKKSESTKDYYERLSSVIKRIVEKHTGPGSILIVGHGSSMDGGVRSLTGKPLNEINRGEMDQMGMHYPYCSVVALEEGQGQKWAVQAAVLPQLTFLGFSNRFNPDYLNRP